MSKLFLYLFFSLQFKVEMGSSCIGCCYHNRCGNQEVRDLTAHSSTGRLQQNTSNVIYFSATRNTTSFTWSFFISCDTTNDLRVFVSFLVKNFHTYKSILWRMAPGNVTVFYRVVPRKKTLPTS